MAIQMKVKYTKTIMQNGIWKAEKRENSKNRI